MTTTIAPPTSGSFASFETVAPATVAEWLRAGTCVLVDVREPDEHARERIAGSQSMPLSRFDPSQLRTLTGTRSGTSPSPTLVLHCRGGRRSADAAATCAALAGAGVRIASMAGGIDAWKAAALPVESNPSMPRMSVMQQTQFTIGFMTLTGLGLGSFVHPAGFLLSALMGCGLVMAGVTGACPLANGLARMPWNRSVASKSCACSDRGCTGGHAG